MRTIAIFITFCVGSLALTAQKSCPAYIGIKTNAMAWAAGLPNIAAELPISRHLSLALPLVWCPWYLSKTYAVKAFSLQPECRWWIKVAGDGHFLGLHTHICLFNVKWQENRYQDTQRPLLGGGISYGYLLPFSDKWAGEFTLGAGYANIRYNTYYNIANGACFETRSRNYWGITKMGISIVYRINNNTR